MTGQYTASVTAPSTRQIRVVRRVAVVGIKAWRVDGTAALSGRGQVVAPPLPRLLCLPPPRPVAAPSYRRAARRRVSPGARLRRRPAIRLAARSPAARQGR